MDILAEAFMPRNKRRGSVADIISLKSLQYFDYDAAVDEVETLVPKYLEVLGQLENSKTFDDIIFYIKKVIAYWTHLSFLLQQIQSLEQDEELDAAILSSLQSELGVLEKIYLKINEVVHFKSEKASSSLWLAADICLNRMDEVLSYMGFAQDHEDRVLLRDVIHANHIKSSGKTSKKEMNFRNLS